MTTTRQEEAPANDGSGMTVREVNELRDSLSGGASTALSVPWEELHRLIPGVVLFGRTRKGFGGDKITERAFRCDNGCTVGTRRGGRLHAADEKTWEVFVLNPLGISLGEKFCFVDAAHVIAMVEAVAAWDVAA